MRGPESGGGRGGDYCLEAQHDPEVAALLDFIEAYTRIQEIMAWLVEAGAGADPAVRGLRRARLQNLMMHLGLDPESPDAFNKLENIKHDLANRTPHPKPRVEIPDEAFFESRIKELIKEQDRFGNPEPPGYAPQGGTSIVDIAQFGHTDWNTVQSRRGAGHPVSEWIRGVASIMADPIAYHAEFAGLGIDSIHKTPDHILITDEWSVQNGRHRSLAARSLGEAFVAEAGMARWVQVNVEPF